ncbi:MAG: YgjV family protein [Candidatus Onthovivens sp.]|nr:YgjV family protein [Candidatus Onthovivens sp.]
MNISIEIIGIIATLFVLISFLMKKAELIRIINIVGAVLFVIYGVLINSISTYILNSCLIIIHIIYLVKYLIDKKKK